MSEPAKDSDPVEQEWELDDWDQLTLNDPMLQTPILKTFKTFNSPPESAMRFMGVQVQSDPVIAPSATPLVEKKGESIQFVRTGTAEFRNYSEQKLEPGDQLILSEYPILPSQAKAPSKDLDEFFKQELETWGKLQKSEDVFVKMVTEMKDDITRLSSKVAPPNAVSAAPIQVIEDLTESVQTIDNKKQRKRDKKRRYKARKQAAKNSATFVNEALQEVAEKKQCSLEEIKRSFGPVYLEQLYAAFQTKPFIVQ